MAWSSKEKANAYAAKNREKMRANFLKWRNKNLDKARKNSLKWAHENAQKISDSWKRFKLKGSFNMKDYIKQWKKDNKDKVRIYKKKYRMLKRNAGEITVSTIREIYSLNKEKYGSFKCELCGNKISEKEISLDHKTPLSRGGDNSKENLWVTDNFCNSKKNSKTVQEYLEGKVN